MVSFTFHRRTICRPAINCAALIFIRFTTCKPTKTNLSSEADHDKWQLQKAFVDEDDCVKWLKAPELVVPSNVSTTEILNFWHITAVVSNLNWGREHLVSVGIFQQHKWIFPLCFILHLRVVQPLGGFNALPHQHRHKSHTVVMDPSRPRSECGPAPGVASYFLPLALSVSASWDFMLPLFFFFFLMDSHLCRPAPSGVSLRSQCVSSKRPTGGANVAGFPLKQTTQGREIKSYSIFFLISPVLVVAALTRSFPPKFWQTAERQIFLKINFNFHLSLIMRSYLLSRSPPPLPTFAHACPNHCCALSWLCAAQSHEDRGRPSYCTAVRALTLRSTSKQLSFLYSCHFKQSFTKPIPPEEWPSIALLFICAFEVPSCWDRLEPRKRGANWMLILVWEPAMSAGKSQVPVRSVAFVHGSHHHHILQAAHAWSFQPQTDSGNFPS